jgi:hypothetical protein
MAIDGGARTARAGSFDMYVWRVAQPSVYLLTRFHNASNVIRPLGDIDYIS